MEKKEMKKSRLLKTNLFLILLIGILLLPLISAIPQDLNLNGRLTNSNGTSLAGIYAMNFSIYNVSEAGNASWSYLTNVSTDSYGVYNVRLTNINLDFLEQYYLGIKVGNDSEMSPRINLSSSAYAFRAQNVSVNGVEFNSNVNINSKNITTTGTGFFSYLGTATSRITGFFARDIDVNGTINFTGNVNIGNNNLSVNGSTLFVDAANARVGIGTTGPGGLLHIYGGAQNLVITANGAGNNYISFRRTATPGTDSFIQYLNGDDLRFYGSGSGGVGDMVTFKNTGNVGIGTTSPSAKLDVNGSGVLLNIKNQSNSFLFVNETSGNIGIGTTGPGAKLEVSGNTILGGTVTVGGEWIGSIGSSIRLQDNSNRMYMRMDGVGNLAFGNSGNVVTIQQNGNVGIGTTTPGAKLEINGSGTLLNIKNQSNSFLFINGSTGNVGIGTTGPGALLDVKSGTLTYPALSPSTVAVIGKDNDVVLELNTGTDDSSIIYFGDSDSRGRGYIWYSHGATTQGPADSLTFAAGATNAVTIQSNGNVGIGTTTPGAKLEINGSGTLLNIKNQSNSFLFINETTGNVGIGTTTPSVKLDVRGVGNFSGTVYFNNGTTVGSGNISGAGASGYLVQFQSGSVVNNSVIFQNGSNIGIGTTGPGGTLGNAVYRLDVEQSTAGQSTVVQISQPDNTNTASHSILELLAGGSSGGDPQIIYTISGASNWAVGVDNSDSDKFKIEAAASLGGATPPFVITTAGNVGIGTTTPSAKLDVSNSSQGVVIHPTGGVGNSPYINTTGTTNVTITSSGGSVIIRLG